jgi:hypothetical protein
VLRFVAVTYLVLLVATIVVGVRHPHPFAWLVGRVFLPL